MEPIKSAWKTLEEEYSLQELCRDFLARKNNLRFDEFKAAAVNAGFQFRHDGTSHVVGSHPTHTLGPIHYNQLNFQEKNGKAKPYQVKQFVDFLRDAQPRGEKNG